MAYDSSNVFARILRGEIPSKKLYEDEFSFAFHDIAPVAPVHILIIPKGEYRHYSDFIRHAPAPLVQGYFKAIGTIAEQEKLSDYRLVSNNGEGAGQTVPHFHMHLLAGKEFGALLTA
jgi:histidine triad (HIT) family protein